MAAHITVFPLGNADSARLDLANGQKVLVEFGNQGNPDDPGDLRCDLTAELRTDVCLGYPRLLTPVWRTNSGGYTLGRLDLFF
jgi:hypothetical protein